MQEERYEIEIVNEGKTLEVRGYEALKAFALKRCDEYRKQVPAEITDYSQYKECKAMRAQLRNTAKAINDRKIIEVHALTDSFVSQCKEVCDLLTSTADLFTEPMERYKGKEKAPKGCIVIKGDEEALNRIEKYLRRNGFEYSRKE